MKKMFGHLHLEIQPDSLPPGDLASLEMAIDKTKILVVDDNPENIYALSQLISFENTEVLSATGAEEALDLLTRHNFALALLDVHMPHMSGFELARLIRGVRKFRHLPMIFVTAHQQDYNVIFEGYETGAVDLMFKPLDPHIVRTKVGVFVQLDRQHRLLHEQMRRLQKLRQDAEAANLAKSQFLANMSHEIRTPLGAVLGFADVLVQNCPAGDVVSECSSAIRRNGNLLLKLIDDILDFSKIEADRHEFDMAPFELGELIDDVQKTLSLKANEKGIRLSICAANKKIGSYISDVVRIKQILLNVIGNAIKFTSKGEVSVTIAREPIEGDRDRLIFTIQDTGVGLNQEQMSRLFQVFSQADASTRKKYGGTGLGLIISRRIARALGGDVQLKASEVGNGSTFEVVLNLQRVQGAADSQAFGTTQNLDVPAQLKENRILVVDDSPDNRLLMNMYLKGMPSQIQFAETGPQAIEAVRSHPIDLILMDIQMPEMDGYEATQVIRQSGFTAPIIAVTAHAMREDHERCLAAGCDMVITKPLNRNELLQRIASVLSRSQSLLAGDI